MIYGFIYLIIDDHSSYIVRLASALCPKGIQQPDATASLPPGWVVTQTANYLAGW
jgi:hypothetical protein